MFTRFETTLALPIEYGTVNVAIVAAGLLFYQEGAYMDTWQVGVMIAGSAIVTGGIQIVHRTRLGCGGAGSARRSRTSLAVSDAHEI